MVRDTRILDGDARPFVPDYSYVDLHEDSVDWRDADTCECPQLVMHRGVCHCAECGTVYAVTERRSVKRWKTVMTWAM